MKKSEIYSEIIDKVCDICEVRRESMINGVRFESVVDARVLAMNAIASDHRDSIRSFLPEQDFLRLSYKMAVDKLTDADRRQYIRAYYNI